MFWTSPSHYFAKFKLFYFIIWCISDAFISGLISQASSFNVLLLLFLYILYGLRIAYDKEIDQTEFELIAYSMCLFEFIDSNLNGLIMLLQHTTFPSSALFYFLELCTDWDLWPLLTSLDTYWSKVSQ